MATTSILAPTADPLFLGAVGGHRRTGQLLASRALGPLAVLAAVAAGSSLFVPWLRTGHTTRSAIVLVGALHQAGLLGGSGGRAFSAAIIAGPALVAGALVAAMLGSVRLASAFAATAGLLLAAAASAVLILAPHRAAGGTVAAMTSGGVAVVAELASLMWNRSSGGHGRDTGNG